MMRRRRAKKIGIVISLVTLVMILGGLELTGYLWEKKMAQGPLGWSLVASRRLDFSSEGSERFPYHVFRPNIEYEWEGISVDINSHGFRTGEYQTDKEEGTVRILNIGDSVAFGWEVPYTKTYGVLLEETLEAKNNDFEYEVITAAIPGWSLSLERNFLMHRGLKLDPDIVILEISLVNDIRDVEKPYSEERNLFGWLRDQTYLWPFLTTQLRFFLSDIQGPEAFAALNPPDYADAYFPLEVENSVYDQKWQYVLDMIKACDDRGIQFILLLFPTAFQVNDSKHPDVPQRAFQLRAEGFNLDIVDLLPVYKEACSHMEEINCEGYENDIFADVWMHPNEQGHKLAAEALIEVIDR
jgi:hypothetical protein